MPQLVITAVGPDRPGLVGEFTRALFEAGANVADSRMVNLRGQFAILALVEGADAVLGSVRERLPQLGKETGLAVTSTAESKPWEPRAGLPFRIKTYSTDQPGIVHRVSSLLRERGVNIEALETKLESAPFAGSPVFTMEMSVTLPPSVHVRELRRELQVACDALDCDVDLEPG